MSMSGEEKTTGEFITIAVKDDGVVRVAVEGIYLVDPDDLAADDQQQLRLTVDGKLMTYDPVIDGKVDDIEDKLDDPATGLAAIEALVDDLENRLTAVRAGYLDELDFDLQGALNVIAAYVDTLETRLTAVRAGYLDELDFDLQGTLTTIDNLVDDLESRLVTGLQTGMTLGDHLLAGNICRNPGFETGDTTGWLSGGTGSWSVQAVTVKHGTYAADIFPDAGNRYEIYTSNLMPCYAGRRVRAQVWMKADVNISSSYIRIVWYHAGGVSFLVTTSPSFGGNYDWTFQKIMVTAPDGATHFRVMVRGWSGGVAGHLYADSVMIPQAPMDGEIHEYAVHTSVIWPELPTTTCTVTSGIGVDTWGAWANLVDSLAATLSAKFAASDGYLAAIHIEDCNVTDNIYHLELRDNVTGEILNRMRFSKALNKNDVGHAIRVRSIRIPAGADIEYRMMDATGGKTAELHIRYYLV